MNPIQIASLTVFHPLDGFPMIRSNRDNHSYWPPIILLLLFFAVKISSIYLIHYPVSSVNVQEKNVVMEVFTFLVPMLSWVVVNYAVTTITEGECKMREIFSALSYCFVPYIILMLPVSLMSHLYGESGASMISFLQTFLMVWAIFQLLLATKSMNDYTLGKTLGVILITLIGILLCWILVLIFYALTGQMIDFLYTFFRELIMIYIE